MKTDPSNVLMLDYGPTSFGAPKGHKSPFVKAHLVGSYAAQISDFQLIQ